jgi:PleD family two-component response regulator
MLKLFFAQSYELLWHDILVPIVLITGTRTEYLAIAALKAGIDDYIIKDSGSRGYLKLLPIVLPQLVQQYHNRRACN